MDMYMRNLYTKEHVKTDNSSTDRWPPQLWDVVYTDDDGMIPWGGHAECPLPDDHLYEIRDDEGEIHLLSKPQTMNWRCVKGYRPIFTGGAVDIGWDGTGLPPVGFICQRLHADGDKWINVEIMGYRDNLVWVRRLNSDLSPAQFMGGERFHISPVEKNIFRPIRTEEQRAEDAAVEDMINSMLMSKSAPFDMTILSMKWAARAIYRAGYRKV